jgi:hypothetical protein
MKLVGMIEVLDFAVKVGRAKVALNSFVFEKRFFSFAKVRLVIVFVSQQPLHFREKARTQIAFVPRNRGL